MLIRASLTDCGFGLTWSLRWRIPLLPLSENKSRAALHLPENIKFAKERAVFLPLGGLFLGSLSWMAFPSSISWSMSPFFQSDNLLSRQAM